MGVTGIWRAGPPAASGPLVYRREVPLSQIPQHMYNAGLARVHGSPLSVIAFILSFAKRYGLSLWSGTSFSGLRCPYTGSERRGWSPYALDMGR